MAERKCIRSLNKTRPYHVRPAWAGGWLDPGRGHGCLCTQAQCGSLLGPFTAGKPQALGIRLPQPRCVRITGCRQRPQDRTSQTHGLHKLKPSVSPLPLKSGYYNVIASCKGKRPAIGENYTSVRAFHTVQVYTAITRRDEPDCTT